MSLGKRLKNAREKKNWSQLYVAKKVGITNAVLSNYERDYRDPDTETLKKLAELYDVSVDYLLGREEDMHIPPMLQDIDPVLARRFIEALKDSKTELFFDNILGASPEEREELIEEFLQVRKEFRKKQEK